MNWPQVPLGEVLTLDIDAVPVDPVAAYPIAGVYSFGRGLLAREPLAGSATTYKTFHRLHTDQIVLSQLKAWEGAIARVPASFDGWFLSPQFPTFRANPARLEIGFLDWYCKQSRVWEELRTGARGMGARRDSVSPARFMSLGVPLPPLVEQRRIVARVDAIAARVAEARRLRDESKTEAEALQRSVFRSIFAGGVSFASLTDVPATVTLSTLRAYKNNINRGRQADVRESIRNETTGSLQMPSHWAIVRFDELCSLITDGTHNTPTYTDEGMPFLSAQNVKPYRFMPFPHRKVSVADYEKYTASVQAEQGDILMTRVGAMIGEAAVIDQPLKFAFYVSLCLLKPLHQFVSVEYLVHWLNSPSGVAAARGNTLGHGHSQGNLNLNLIRGFQVPFPPLDEQRRIVAHLDALQAKLDAARAEQSATATELDALLPSVLNRAFAGEL